MNSILKSLIIKILAVVSFVLINLIGFKAFSAEVLTATPLPACQIQSGGLLDNKWKHVRIQIGSETVAGAETLSEMRAQIKRLVNENKCFPVPVSCTLASEGQAMGTWVKHRILIQDITAFGSDTTARLFDQLGQLKQMGVCE